MTTTVEMITPDKATEYLGCIVRQRPLVERTAARYAADMKSGHWLLTHQGIAFDDFGTLVDGQHRLRAIQLAKEPVQMLVTRGLPRTQENGSVNYTMDSFDRGQKRTIGDQLEMTGTKGGKTVAAICTAIAFCAAGRTAALTTAQTRGIMLQFGAEIEAVMARRSAEPGIRTATLMGSVAFAMNVESEKITEFYRLPVTREGLFAQGPTSPVFHLSHNLTKIQAKDGWTVRTKMAHAALNACHAFVEGRAMSEPIFTLDGRKHFQNLQPNVCAQIKEGI